MALYSERHGMRKPIKRTSTISSEMYALLFDCCEKYHENLAWKFPEQCPDGRGICGFDAAKFSNELLFEIPELFRRYDKIVIPGKKEYSSDDEDFDQYALLDYIEFIGQNCKDVSRRTWHSFFGHDDMSFSNKSDIFEDFRNEINGIFLKVGLLFVLTEEKIIERVIEDSVLTPDVEAVVEAVIEPGTKELLEEAIALFKHPNPAARNDAVEKLWDAFERLKTYYTTLDKRTSATKIVEDMSNKQTEFEQLFNDEFVALTKIGNDYRIRHHETNKIDIQDMRHYDYFFNRCLALIATAIQYLQ